MKHKTHCYRISDQKRTHLNSSADVRSNFRVDLFASINIESEISSRSAPAGYCGISDVISNVIRYLLKPLLLQLFIYGTEKHRNNDMVSKEVVNLNSAAAYDRVSTYSDVL